jgi:hypothetical protein
VRAGSDPGHPACPPAAGETRLRWQCQGIWHEQILPITRRGTLQELVWLPVGACQVGLLASSEGAECELNIARFAQVSAGNSLWRRCAGCGLFISA